MDDVAKICIDFDFEEEKIDEYLKMFDIEEKYKNIPAYEWQTTKTKEQKDHERRKKLMDAMRAKWRENKRKRLEEENRVRREERQKQRDL
jgi:hypothetical protein